MISSAVFRPGPPKRPKGFPDPGVFPGVLMSLLGKLSLRESWERFYCYKTSLACPKSQIRELRAFIDEEAWAPVCDNIREGIPFPLPRKAVISKLSSQKKRTVYVYPEAENRVLKLLTHLLLRKYDALFSRNLYSFRPGRNAKDAVRTILAIPGINRKYAYKADIHDYFNSIPVEKLLPELQAVTSGDPALYAFLSGLLLEPRVLDRGTPHEERKGIMAGTPLSSFYANLYLRDLDALFEKEGIPYVRYSDDIIVFRDSMEECQRSAERIRTFLAEKGLSMNPDKEQFFAPEDGFIFLGFSYRAGVIDIAPASVLKLKRKMRRKARALSRWQDRSCLSREKAARAFIRIFNRKLLEEADDSDLSWSRWFFSVINTTESLRVIDHYAQDCLRVLLSGTRTKARYNTRYEDLKALGYRSLVHAYYAYRKDEATSSDSV